MVNKYTIKDFDKQYPTDNSCLHEIFLNRYGKLKICPSCSKHTRFHKVTNRKCYACQFCSFQLHPLADTIFHKSETPLKTWFYAIFFTRTDFVSCNDFKGCEASLISCFSSITILI